MQRIHQRLSYANVMSSIAVFLVLGGATAFAAGTLGRGSVGSKQLKAQAVTASKIKDKAITTAKVSDRAITGAKIDLASLGTVPSATTAANATTATNAVNAANASTVNGRTVTKVFVKIPVSSSVTIGTFGAFVVSAECDGLGNVENLVIDPDASDADMQMQGNGDKGPIFEEEHGAEPNPMPLDRSRELGGNNNSRGVTTFSAAQSGGAEVSGTLAYDDTNSFDEEPVCTVHGDIVS